MRSRVTRSNGGANDRAIKQGTERAKRFPTQPNMPVIELATFQASEALLANPDLALGALEILKNSDGFLGYDEN